MEKIDLKEILRKVLIANDISEESFSMDGYKEDAICIDKLSEGYLVYHAVEGKKYDRESCARLLNACYAVIPRVSNTLRQISQIRSSFVDNVIFEALEKLGIED